MRRDCIKIIVPKVCMFIVLLICLGLASPATAQSGDGYDLTWSTIDGGGGASTGDGYSLTGAVGQPDAGVMIGGSYTLTGGFWSSGIPCFVNMDDLENFLTDWLDGGTNLPGDLDGDNKVDMVDFGILASNWLCRCPADWPL